MITSLLYVFVCFATAIAAMRPLGYYMAKVYKGERTFLEPVLGMPERILYRLCGIDPRQESSWWAYASAMLLLGLFGFVALFAIFTFQNDLPLNPQGFPGLPCDLAFNAAISFVTNTNWQSYSGETTLSYFSQMFGCVVQNFLSAATAMAVAAALFRSLARKQMQTIGNPYVDVVRSTLYILLPLSLILAVLLASQGVIQNFNAYTSFTPISGGSEQFLPQGPVASQVAIKILGSNGGGFFNANSAHPFENPTPFSNFMELVSLLLIPFAFTSLFGTMIADKRQGWMLFAAMTVVFLPLTYLSLSQELNPNPHVDASIIDVSDGNMEGKETRLGIASSALWGMATSATASGSVNGMHDSYMPLSGMGYMLLMQLGEVVYGGVGSGMYGLLMFALLTVFIGGLMVGRTPEFLGKKLNAFDVKMASLVMLVPTTLVLAGTAICVTAEAGRAGAFNPGAQAFAEILYAVSSAANNNGSAYGGLNAATPFYNIVLGIIMLLGRYGVMLPVLAAAGSLVQKNTVPLSAGTLPTHTPMFCGLLVGVIILIGALNYVPALALASVVEHIHMTTGSSQ